VKQGNTTHCNGQRRDGQPCQSQVLDAAGFCFMHSPANTDRLHDVHVNAGYARSKTSRASKLLPATLRPVLDRLLAALAKVEDGSITTQQATALASLAGAVVRVYTSGTLEERLQALEAAQQNGKSA